MSGVKTTDFTAASAVDEVLANVIGVGTRRVAVNTLAQQFLGDGPIADVIDELTTAVTGGQRAPFEPVTVATTGNVTLSGEQTIDGVLTSASAVLVLRQSSGATVTMGDGRTDSPQNGLYITGAGAWTRRADADTGAELMYKSVLVLEGTANGGTSWRCGNATTPLIGTNGIIFIQVGDVDSVSLEVQADLADLADDVTALTATVSGLSGDIGDVASDVSAFAADIAEIGAKIPDSDTDGYVWLNGDGYQEMSLIDGVLRTGLMADRDEVFVLGRIIEDAIFRITDDDGYVFFEVTSSGLDLTGALDPDSGLYPSLRRYVEIGSDASGDMVLNWHADTDAPLIAEYRVHGASDWQSAGATKRDFPGATEKVFSARLRNLSPNTRYEWRNVGSRDQVSTFWTLPDDESRDLRVVFVSDAQTPSQFTNPTSNFNKICNEIRDVEPDLIVMGGDYVDDDGVQNATKAGYWANFLNALETRFVRSDGSAIPLVAMTGNHEVESAEWYAGTGDRGYVDKLFNCLYRTHWDTTGGAGYGYFTVGKQLMFICLETNHGTPLADQVQWLDDLMQAKAADYRHVMLAAHVPPFPNLDDYWDSFTGWGAISRTVRREIIPLIQDYPNVRFMVTGHQHMITATPLIKVDAAETGTQQRWEADADGIRVLGCGGWSAEFMMDLETQDRVSDIDASSWIDVALNTQDYTQIGITPVSALTGVGSDPAIKHFWMFDLATDDITATCVNIDGGVYKSYTETI